MRVYNVYITHSLGFLPNPMKLVRNTDPNLIVWFLLTINLFFFLVASITFEDGKLEIPPST